MQKTHYTIVTILYHSEKWIDDYIQSILDTEYDKSCIDLILLDNAPDSSDHMKLDALKEDLEKLNSYRYLALKKGDEFTGGHA